MRISDGNTEKSSARLICMETSRTSSAVVMFSPSSGWGTAEGSGTTSMSTIETTPTGTATFDSLPTEDLSAVRHAISTAPLQGPAASLRVVGGSGVLYQ